MKIKFSMNFSASISDEYEVDEKPNIIPTNVIKRNIENLLKEVLSKNCVVCVHIDNAEVKQL